MLKNYNYKYKKPDKKNKKYDNEKSDLKANSHSILNTYSKKKSLFMLIILIVSLILIFFNLFTNVIIASDQKGNTEDYLLNYKDILEIRLWGYPELTTTSIVQPDGMMSLPLDGQIYVAGKTLEEVRMEITKEMQKSLPSLESNQVSLTIKDFSTIDISVLGEVNSPGLFKITGAANVLKAISFARGLTENADLKSASIIRESGEVITIDLDRLFHCNDMSQNYQLFSGDSLYIPRLYEMKTISVGGEVNSPGLYTLEGEIDVLKAISVAKGVTKKADLKNALVKRQSGIVVPINLEKLLLENDLTYNIVLDYGDSLFIPMTLENNVYVLGEVENPGLYPIEGSCSVIEAITLAGGYTSKARLSSCLIIRKLPVGEEGISRCSIDLKEVKVIREEYDQVIEVDLKKILKEGYLAQNIVLKPQDIIYLPSRPLSELNIANTLDIIQTSIAIYNVLK